MYIVECVRKMYADSLTCVAADEDGIVFTSREKGIKPMLDLLKRYETGECKPLYQSDMIIGKAAVLIADHCGVKWIYADVVSEAAIKLSHERGIDIAYRERVPRILNRQKTEEGPYEAALNGVDLDDFSLVMETVRKVAERLGQL